MLISLSSPRAVIAHFRYQRSTGTTRRTTGESSIAPEPSYRGRGPASGEKIDRSMAITVHACAFNLRTRVRYSAVCTFRILSVTCIVRTRNLSSSITSHENTGGCYRLSIRTCITHSNMLQSTTPAIIIFIQCYAL